MLLPTVLKEGRGNCLGLGALYLALGEYLGWRLSGALAPGHFFIRDEQSGRNIELLRRGQNMADKWYRSKYRIPEGNNLYLRALSSRETLAVFDYNLANELRARRRLSRAREVYRRVVATLPEFAEAHANLGLTYHHLGDYRAAEQAYRRAQQANPQLTGLRDNMTRLRKSVTPKSIVEQP